MNSRKGGTRIFTAELEKLQHFSEIAGAECRTDRCDSVREMGIEDRIEAFDRVVDEIVSARAVSMKLDEGRKDKLLGAIDDLKLARIETLGDIGYPSVIDHNKSVADDTVRDNSTFYRKGFRHLLYTLISGIGEVSATLAA